MTVTPIPVFCLPYAGGTAGAYQRWRRHFPSEFEVVPLEIAGRGARVTESSPRSIHELADDLSRQLHGHQLRLATGYVLFGHSMGASTAFEMALTYPDHGLPAPTLVVISGRNPPYLRSRWGIEVLDLSDRELLTMLQVLGGVPAGPLLSSPVHFVPRLRADLRISIEYRLKAADAAVDIPLLVMRGRADPLVDPNHVTGWERYTRQQSTVRHHNGGHFALFERNSLVDELINAIRGVLGFSYGSCRS
ncbi:MAG TPA: thioesterase domain-containing protein [Streptosporangiaceae bacterium]|nr:thioesterase domain-containing protein [Streptosporangiaceae bacterium]